MPTAIAQRGRDPAGEVSARGEQLAIDADNPVVALSDVIEPADVDGKLIGVLGVLASFILEHDTVLRPHQVTVRDDGAVPIHQRGVRFGLRKSGSNHRQTKQRLASRIGAGPDERERLTQSGGAASAWPHVDRMNQLVRPRRGHTSTHQSIAHDHQLVDGEEGRTLAPGVHGRRDPHTVWQLRHGHSRGRLMADDTRAAHCSVRIPIRDVQTLRHGSLR